MNLPAKREFLWIAWTVLFACPIPHGYAQGPKKPAEQWQSRGIESALNDPLSSVQLLALQQMLSFSRVDGISPSQITPSTLHSPPLLYLTACINEGLRLFPPLPGNLRRIVPKDGKVISGRWVPGGTLVAVDILAANLSRENFALPDNFCPERWLGEERKGNLFEGDRGEVVKPVSSSLSILGWKGSEEMLMMLE